MAATPILPAGAAELHAVWFPDATHGYAAGSLAHASGVVLASVDGGTSWAPQAVPADVAELYALSFPDDALGWAVGEDQAGSPEVIATSTAGATWRRLALPPGVDAESGWFTGASFVDDAHGWVVGLKSGPSGTPQTPLLLATSDGGLTWTDETSTTGSTDVPSAVAFVDATHGWLSLNTGLVATLLATSDGGHSWSKQDGINFTGPVGGMRFVDPADGFIASNSPYLAFTQPAQVSVTHDGGITWQTTAVPGNTVRALAASDAHHAWVFVTDGGLHVHATSDGSTWNDISSTATDRIMSAAAPGGMLVVAGGAPSGVAALATSSDGGATWNDRLPADPYVSRVQVLHNDPLIAVTHDSSGGATLQSAANGALTSHPLPAWADLYEPSVSFPTASDGWLMCADTSAPYLCSTHDGGVSWQKQPVSDPALSVVDFYDTTHGVMYGSLAGTTYSVISVTTDGGASWTNGAAPYFGTRAPTADAVRFVDATHLWATILDRTGAEQLASSSDGGLTWQQAAPIRAGDDEYWDFSFSDPTHGWVVGQSLDTQAGFMATTADGGQTWSVQNTPVSVGVTSVDFAPGSTTRGWRIVTATANVAGIYPVGSALESTSDGVHWLPDYVPDQLPYVGRVRATDFLHAWVSGGDKLGHPVVDATADGGVTWTRVSPDAWGVPPSAQAQATPGPFVPITPVRICDTRAASATEPANQCSNRRVGTSGNADLETLDFQTAGLAGLPRDPSQYSAVVLHVTATGADSNSYVTNFPSGFPRPLASNLNTAPNATVGNLVEVATGADGHLELFNAQGTTDLVVDVEGYVSSAAGNGAGFVGVTPYRACDTRTAVSAGSSQCSGQTMHAGTTREVQVTGLAGSGIPVSGVSAVVLNATVSGPSGAGYVTVYPAGGARPLASSLNFAAGQVVANRVTVPVGPCSSGTGACVSVYNYAGDVDLVLDVSGYYTSTAAAPAGARFTAMIPTRLCDTRSPSATNITVCAGQSLVGGAPYSLAVAGADGIPANATAVVANVTVTGSSSAAYLTVFPGTATRPVASDVNFTAGQTVPNLVVTALGSDGTIDLYIPWGTADVVVDVVGYYS